MNLSIIAAMSANRVIGRQNSLPWRLPADLARFKRLTMGHPVIVGRKTFEAIGRPLPGRTMIVLTRRPDYAPEGTLVAHSLEEAIGMAQSDEVFVIGGEQIYRQALPRAHRLYLTLVEAQFEGDAVFPEFSRSEWQLVSSEQHSADDKNPYPYTFLVYERKERPPQIPRQP